MFYRQPGLLYPRFPPKLPIPRDFGQEGFVGSSSSASSYEPAQRVLPIYMGNTFPLVCEFWHIMQEVSLAYFSRQEDPNANVSLDFAEIKYRELLAWMETLPASAIRNDCSPHHVMIFQSVKHHPAP